MNRSLVLMAAMAGLYGLPAQAQSDLDSAGQTIFLQGVVQGRPACAACHMQNASGQPDVGIPRLAGLSTSYMVDQLGYFASGQRQNAAMSSYAAMLTPAQRLEVATYLQTLPLPPPPDVPAESKTQLAQGQVLFLNGDTATGLIGCTQCHGPAGQGVGEFSPRIGGQSAAYLMSELTDWRAGALRDPQGIYMRSIASHLTPSDLQAVAAYVASLTDPGAPTP